MRGRSESIMMTLFGISKSHGKVYCYPSQKTILRLLNKYHSFEISRRTLNRDLAALQDEGYIRRIRRLTERGVRAGRFSSTLYKFTGKAFNYLYGLKKWVEGVFSFCRVPKVAHNESQTENEISSRLPRGVEFLWKPGLKGMPSPVYLDREGR